jgi:hypothetical protein
MQEPLTVHTHALHYLCNNYNQALKTSINFNSMLSIYVLLGAIALLATISALPTIIEDYRKEHHK